MAMAASVAATDRCDIVWGEETEQGWRRHLNAAAQTSLEQSWAYGIAVSQIHGVAVERGIVRQDDHPVALVQAFRRKLPAGASLMRIVRGPVWLTPPDRPAAEAVFRAIRASFPLRHGSILSAVPELPDAPWAQEAMRAVGMRRMVTGYTSIRIDLTQDLPVLRARLDAKWRNKLTAVERGRVAVEAVRGGKILDDLMAAHDSFRKQRRFVGPSGALVLAMAQAAPKDVLTLVARDGRETVAGIVVVRHGSGATYFVGWSGEEGRRKKAHNLLLWRAIAALKEAGVSEFDLGGVDAVHAPGVARFKLGMGGEVFTLAGSYL